MLFAFESHSVVKCTIALCLHGTKTSVGEGNLSFWSSEDSMRRDLLNYTQAEASQTGGAISVTTNTITSPNAASCHQPQGTQGA